LITKHVTFKVSHYLAGCLEFIVLAFMS